ncbi:MAG: hypothetical protein LUD72_11030 [Bacteroidales bacterium]|nr:hypothetical protein [Bacteroidales bacterium]
MCGVNLCSELLEKLFDIHRFYAFKGHTPAATEDAYRVYREKIIEKINGYLYVDKAEMVYVKDRYVVRKIADRATPVERATERVDVGYIEEAKKEVLDFIDRRQYNEAIGAACKLLESVFVYICDRHKIKKSKDMRSKYYNQIVKLYDICPQNETDRKLQDLWRG